MYDTWTKSGKVQSHWMIISDVNNVLSVLITDLLINGKV